jgi:hypothetical protein
MSTQKVTLIAYMTAEEKNRLKSMAKKHLKTMGEYIAQLVIWDEQLDLFNKARRGMIQKD